MSNKTNSQDTMDLTLPSATRVKLDFNDKEVFRQDLPAGPHTFDLAELCPPGPGTVVIFFADPGSEEFMAILEIERK